MDIAKKMKKRKINLKEKVESNTSSTIFQGKRKEKEKFKN